MIMPVRTPWRLRAARPKELPDRSSRGAQVLLPNITSLDGGVPIKLGNEVIGGVGVAGSPGKDEQCASAGLEKVKAALQ